MRAQKTTHSQAPKLPQKQQLSLFVLMGQSNMAGKAPPPYPRLSHKRLFLFGNNYRWSLASIPLDSPTGQVDEVSLDPAAGMGPGMPFGRAWLKTRPQGSLGFIPCAKWGASLYQWRPTTSDQSLYGSCLKRMAAASTSGTLKGVLFFQGEADALSPQSYPKRRPGATTWRMRFTQLVRRLRHDLQTPTLPFVFAQISKHPGDESTFPGWREVQKQQAAVSLPKVKMIRTDDLPHRDPLHFTKAGYIRLGKRFAKAYNALTNHQ